MNIDTILGGPKNPLVLLNRMVSANRIQRGMGFVYKNLSRKHKVIVTCKHHFLQFSLSEWGLLLGQNHHPLRIIKMFDPGKDVDLVFVLVEDPNQAPNIELSKKGNVARKKERSILFNCKNDYSPFTFQFPFYVMSQQFVHSDLHMALSSLESTTGSLVPTSELHLVAGQVIYPTIGMRTMKGCSGSPIFDERMRLYGLNLRGVGPQSDIMGYLPTDEIEKHYLSLKKEINAAKP